MLTKAIVDQHFSQKGRSMRLRTAICRSPERTGIGIDESTGLFISPQKSKVVGEGSVFVYKMNGTSRIAPIESPSQHFLDFESVMDTTQLINGDEIATLDLDVFAN
jgi:cyanophycinase-like exopeptidase